MLSTTKVGDNALVVHTLSREWGRRGFLVRSARKTGTTLFLPLNILEAEVVENSKSELWTLKNIVLRDALPGIRGNLQKNTMTLFLSEVLFRTIKDGANEDGLYEWCVGSVLTLNALESDYANFPVRFLMELAGALGFRPSFDGIAPFAKGKIPHAKGQGTLERTCRDTPRHRLQGPLYDDSHTRIDNLGARHLGWHRLRHL